MLQHFTVFVKPVIPTVYSIMFSIVISVHFAFYMYDNVAFATYAPVILRPDDQLTLSLQFPGRVPVQDLI